ncbi:MAG: DUF4412 domain-containing protein [Bacteroidota bacterium]
MKRILFTALLSALILCAIAEKGWVFTQKYESADSKGQNITVSWYVTSQQCKMKMEFSDAKVNTVSWFIADMQQNKLLTYAEGSVPSGAQKAFFAIPVQNIKADKTSGTARVSAQATGETKSVSGLLCEKVLVKTNKNITEMWVSKDFKPAFYKFYPFFQNSIELMALSEEKIQGFPVSSQTKDISGQVTASYQLLSAQSIELSEADFKVPSEYKDAEEIHNGKN